VCLKEASDPPETDQDVERWKSKPPLSPIWSRHIERVLLKVDSSDDAQIYPETLEAVRERLLQSLGPPEGVEWVQGEPLTPERLGPYVQTWKIYTDPERSMRVRIPPDVKEDLPYLEKFLLEKFSGARVRRSGSDSWEDFGKEDAKRMAADLVFEGTLSEVDYDRLFRDLRPRNIAEGTYLIHLWSDGYSRESGGGTSVWSRRDPAILRLERKVLEGQAVLHISTRTLERSTALHELGHILGLVSNPAHHRSGHCTNPACIMYPGRVNVRTLLANFFTGILGQPKSSFCGECEADLERYREASRAAED
jgi:hypothetical protein